MEPSELPNPYAAPKALSDPKRERSPIENAAASRWRRAFSLLFLFALAAVFVDMGFDGSEVNMIPAHYLGYFLGVFAVLGLFGVNIWRGGPVDPRADPRAPEAGSLVAGTRQTSDSPPAQG